MAAVQETVGSLGWCADDDEAAVRPWTGSALARTARSHLPRALTLVFAAPGLADNLSITPQAALGLLRQLTGAGAVASAARNAATMAGEAGSGSAPRARHQAAKIAKSER